MVFRVLNKNISSLKLTINFRQVHESMKFFFLFFFGWVKVISIFIQSNGVEKHVDVWKMLSMELWGVVLYLDLNLSSWTVLVRVSERGQTVWIVVHILFSSHILKFTTKHRKLYQIHLSSTMSTVYQIHLLFWSLLCSTGKMNFSSRDKSDPSAFGRTWICKIQSV